MFGLDFKAAKEGFFDRAKVMAAENRATLKVLNEIGRLIRKTAQASLVYASGVSSPGSPPHAHRSRTITKTSRRTGKRRVRTVSFLREYLFYSYVPASRSVVIGPVRLDSTLAPESLPALEYGGSSTILDHGSEKVVTIRARPFMSPALAKELPGLPALWKDSIR